MTRNIRAAAAAAPKPVFGPAVRNCVTAVGGFLVMAIVLVGAKAVAPANDYALDSFARSESNEAKYRQIMVKEVQRRLALWE